MKTMDQRAKILIVDDEPFNVDYLQQELEDLDYDTLSASNGQEALEQVATGSPDLILLDIMMPVMDGFEVLARLKADKATRDIPVVVISATHERDAVVRGIELGAEDYLPKPFDPVLLQARIRSSLERKVLRDQEQLYLKGLERELDIGRQIQAEFLPTTLPQLPGWEVVAYFQAAREVAGDFYDAFNLARDGQLALLVGDVSDKGVGAALYMTLFRTLLRAVASVDEFTDRSGHAVPVTDPLARYADTLGTVALTNNYVAHIHGHSSMFATVFFGLLDPVSGYLRYINAGHEPPIIFNDHGAIRNLATTGPVVGILHDVIFPWEEAKLEPGDTLLIFTDGIIEAHNVRKELFGRERLLALLEQSHETATSLLDHIVEDLRAHMGTAGQFDDMTILAVRRNS